MVNLIETKAINFKAINNVLDAKIVLKTHFFIIFLSTPRIVFHDRYHY